MDLEWALPFRQPGASHIHQRKMIRQGIGSQGIGDYDSTIEVEIAKYTLGLKVFQGNPNSSIQK
jgi:hypothetical protein